MIARRTLLPLSLLLMSGCAGSGAMRGLGGHPDLDRYAAALRASAEAAQAAIGRMDAFERMALREDGAIAFAMGGPVRGGRGAGPSPAGAAEAADRVLAACFSALALYADALDGAPPQAPPSPDGLVDAARQGLEALRTGAGVTVPDAVRQAGLSGIGALAGTPGTAVDVAAETPQVAAVAALMRAVIGADVGQGTRGVIRTRRLALDQRQDRFLARLAGDGRLGPAERYGMYRNLAALREEDPAPGTFAALLGVLDAIAAAQAALAGAAPEVRERLAGLEAANARLVALNQASRRS